MTRAPYPSEGETMTSKTRFRPSRPSFHSPPFPLLTKKPLPSDFKELTSLIRDLWEKAAYSDRTRMLQALEAAAHRIGSS